MSLIATVIEPTKPVRRPPHPNVQVVVDMVAKGETLEAIQTFTRKASAQGGQIWPVEYYFLREVNPYEYEKDVTAPASIEELKQRLDALLANSIYDFPFQPGDMVVNILGTPDFQDEHGCMTGLKVYEVDSCYDGHSGCGEQTWVRVTNDKGQISGYDPDRFMLLDEWQAIRTARLNGGKLWRPKATVGGWRGGIDQGSILDDTVQRLVERGVFRFASDSTVTAVFLSESAYQIKKAGFQLTPEERVAQALQRALDDISNLAVSTDPVRERFAAPGTFNMPKLAAAVLAELGGVKGA